MHTTIDFRIIWVLIVMGLAMGMASGVARIWLGAMEWEIKQAYTLNGVNFNFYFWLNSGISGFEVSNRCEACND